LVYLACLDQEPAGVFVLRWSDERVWGPDDSAGGYVHRLAVRSALAGRGLGRQLLATAAMTAIAHHRTWLRLDCDRSNQALRAYYERLGFVHVRDCERLPRTTRPGTRAASLYQCRARDLAITHS
jgi:ribosomal protein S18 acetylase RimI-like enzyme